MTLHLELIRGRSNDGTRLLDAPGAFVVGSSVRSDWRVVARGVRPSHFVLSWDGVALVVQSACEPGAVEVDDRVVTTPFAITGAAQVRFGEAVVRVLPTPVRDDTPTLIASLGDEPSNDDSSNDVTRIMQVVRPSVVAPPLPSDVGEDAAAVPSAGAETCREGVTPAPHSFVTEEITDLELESVGRFRSLRALALAFAARPRWVVGGAAVAASTFVGSAWAVHAHRASVAHDAAAPLVASASPASAAVATPSRTNAPAATVVPATTTTATTATTATTTTVPTLPRPAEQSAHPSTTSASVVGGATEASPMSPDLAAKLLAAGEHDDAERAYAALARRYPDEPVYRVIVTALSDDSSIAARGEGTER
jgi:hypothetical protein